MKTKQKRHSKFLEVFHEHQDTSNYSRLKRPEHWNIRRNDNNCTNQNTSTTNEIQLQSLDASSLLLIHNRNLDIPYEPMTEATSPAGSSLDLEWENEYAGTSFNLAWLHPRDETTTTFDDGISDRYGDGGSSVGAVGDGEDNSLSEYSKDTSNHRISHISRSRRIKNRENDLNLKMKTDSTSRSISRSSWSHRSTPDSLEWDTHEDDHKLKSEDDALDLETIELLQEIEWLKNRALNETSDGAMVHLDDCNCELES